MRKDDIILKITQK